MVIIQLSGHLRHGPGDLAAQLGAIQIQVVEREIPSHLPRRRSKKSYTESEYNILNVLLYI